MILCRSRQASGCTKHVEQRKLAMETAKTKSKTRPFNARCFAMTRPTRQNRRSVMNRVARDRVVMTCLVATCRRSRRNSRSRLTKVGFLTLSATFRCKLRPARGGNNSSNETSRNIAISPESKCTARATGPFDRSRVLKTEVTVSDSEIVYAEETISVGGILKRNY